MQALGNNKNIVKDDEQTSMINDPNKNNNNNNTNQNNSKLSNFL